MTVLLSADIMCLVAQYTERLRGGIHIKFVIKEMRERLGLSQTELAQRSGITRATLWALESGAADCTTTKTLSRIADVLGCTMDELVSDRTA